LNPPNNELTATFDDRAAAIVTWSDRGVLRVYDCDVCGELQTLERRADARITGRRRAPSVGATACDPL
jgi:hypothetical protein